MIIVRYRASMFKRHRKIFFKWSSFHIHLFFSSKILWRILKRDFTSFKIWTSISCAKTYRICPLINDHVLLLFFILCGDSDDIHEMMNCAWTKLFYNLGILCWNIKRNVQRYQNEPYVYLMCIVKSNFSIDQWSFFGIIPQSVSFIRRYSWNE